MVLAYCKKISPDRNQIVIGTDKQLPWLGRYQNMQELKISLLYEIAT